MSKDGQPGHLKSFPQNIKRLDVPTRYCSSFPDAFATRTCPPWTPCHDPSDESEHGRSQPFTVLKLQSFTLQARVQGQAFRRIVRVDGAACHGRSASRDEPNSQHGTADEADSNTQRHWPGSPKKAHFPLPWPSPCETCATLHNAVPVHLHPGTPASFSNLTRLLREPTTAPSPDRRVSGHAAGDTLPLRGKEPSHGIPVSASACELKVVAKHIVPRSYRAVDNSTEPPRRTVPRVQPGPSSKHESENNKTSCIPPRAITRAPPHQEIDTLTRLSPRKEWYPRSRPV